MRYFKPFSEEMPRFDGCTIFRGVPTMTEEVWREVKELEKERRRRAAHLPQRARVNGPLAGAGLA